jgi:proline iminopeptidase
MKSVKKIFMLALAATLFFACKEERFIYEEGYLVPKTVEHDPNLPSITVDGVKLHSQAFGHPDSTIVVCLHGGPGGDFRYMLNCKDLALQGYRVVFYDQRGSGLSQRLPKSYYTSLGENLTDMIYDELASVIAYYRTGKYQKVYLLGHSWGGMLATGFTGRYPNAVQGLVVMEPGGFKWDDVIDYSSKAISFNIWSEDFNNAVYGDQFITGKEDEHAVLDYRMALLISKNKVTGDDDSKPGSFWRSGAIVNTSYTEIGSKYKFDFDRGIEEFKIPVLFFYSEKNKAYTDSWAKKISGSYNSVNLIKIAGVGHNDIIFDKKAWTTATLPEILKYFNSL